MQRCDDCYALYRNPMDDRLSGHLRRAECEGNLYVGEPPRSRVIEHRCSCGASWLRFEAMDGTFQEWKQGPDLRGQPVVPKFNEEAVARALRNHPDRSERE